MKRKIKFIIKMIFLFIMLSTVVVLADTSSEEKNVKLKDLSLIEGYNSTIIGESLTNIFNVEVEGVDYIDMITMYAKNVEDENQYVHITLVTGGMHVRDILTRNPVTNGTYYISDVYVNPNLESYVRFSKDLSEEGVLPLELDLKFEVVGQKAPVDLTSLSLYSSINPITLGENLTNVFDVGVLSNERVETISMYAKNKRDEKQIIHIVLSSNQMHIRDDITQNPLTTGTYYISDIFVNPETPNSSISVRYSKDKSLDGIIPLDFYLEFDFEIEEDIVEEVPLNTEEEILEEENIETNNEIDNTENTNKVENKITDNKNVEKEAKGKSSIFIVLAIIFIIFVIIILIVIIKCKKNNKTKK